MAGVQNIRSSREIKGLAVTQVRGSSGFRAQSATPLGGSPPETIGTQGGCDS